MKSLVLILILTLKHEVEIERQSRGCSNDKNENEGEKWSVWAVRKISATLGGGSITDNYTGILRERKMTLEMFF